MPATFLLYSTLSCELYHGRADPGDISQQIELRKRLECKSFKWFMANVAYDQDKHYPAVIPTPFAQGSIRSQKDPRFCVEASFTNK